MANPEHLAILEKGVEAWNEWRQAYPKEWPRLDDANLAGADLRRADLSRANLNKAHMGFAHPGEASFSERYGYGADLSGANLNGASLLYADLSGACLCGAVLREANLNGANLSCANLNGVDLSGNNLCFADLSSARLEGAKLCKAGLMDADLTHANLCGADLTGADLFGAVLRCSDFTGATLTGCRIHGISAWDVKLDGAKQSGLLITNALQPPITVDNLEVAQFVYMLLNNAKLRDVIDTMTGKAVLILGRFGKRKVILDSIADELRKRDYLPIMFDFDRPIDRNFRETVQTLAGLSKFVIADLTDPKSTPLESLAIFYNYRIPFLPLIQEGQEPFSMFHDFTLEVGYIPPVQFRDVDEIKSIFDKQILAPAEAKHKMIREAKAK